MALTISADNAKIIWLSSKSKSKKLQSGQGVIYLAHSKVGQFTADSYSGKTPQEGFVIRYKQHQSALFENVDADCLIVFDKIYGDDYDYDDFIRVLVNQIFMNNKIDFSANVKSNQVDGFNAESLINFDLNRDKETLIKIIKQYFGIETYYDDRDPIIFRFNQENVVENVVDVLKKEKLCLLASYTGSGKTITAIESSVRLLNQGGFVLVTTPIVDTMLSFKNDINKFHFGDNRELEVTYIDNKEFNKIGMDVIQKRVKCGELIFLVLSVQDIRYETTDEIREKYKMLDNNIDLWIRDERHYQYEGEVTKKKFLNLRSRYQLDLTATPYNVYSYYSEKLVVSQTLIWGLLNSEYTNLPNVSIESFNSIFSGLSTSIKDMYNIDEGFNPKKLFVRDLDTKQFIHESELINFAFSCYCKSFSKSKNPFSINNDTKLSNMSKKYGMWVLPNGINKDSATDYIPALAQLLNDNINDDIYFIDSYQLEKDAKNDSKTVGKYYEKLTTKYNRVIILTCGKFLTGSDIPLLGHLVLLDKIHNISTFEQIMGRILRVVDGKKFTKIYSLSPSNELGLVLGKLSKANSYLSGDESIKILDNIPITEYINGNIVEFSAEDILKDTQDWFISQLSTGTPSYLFENSLINDVDIDVLKTLSNSKTGKSLPPSTEINDDNGSKVSEKKEKGEKVEKDDLSKKDSNVITNALNLLKNVITEATWVAYTEENYDYNELFKSETMKKMFHEEDLNVIVDDVLNKSKKMSNRVNEMFMNKKLTFDSLSPIEVSKYIFINSKFKQNMGIVYMSSEIANELVEETSINDNDTVLVYNALNGALPLSIKSKYPNSIIYCDEIFPQYKDYLIDCGFKIHKKGDKMKYDAVLLNSPYQKIVGLDSETTQSKSIWAEINVNAFNLIKDGGYMATIHPSGWRFSINSKSKIRDLYSIYKSHKIEYMELNNYTQGKKTFNAMTDYDVIVVQKEKSNGDVIIKTKSDGLYKTNLHNFDMIPTDKIELFEYLRGNDNSDKVEILHNYSYGHRYDYVSKEKTNEFKHPLVYSYRNKLKLYYSNTTDRGHFGISKLIIPFSSENIILDLDGKYGMCEYSCAIIDTPENLIEIKKVIESDKFKELKGYFIGKNDGINYIFDYRGMMVKFIREFKKDWWKDFDID